MYETHFGLKRRPFRALALGNDVFIGPQTATVTAGIKKALSTPDAIVAVSGPVGGGKTTLVGRALEGVGKNRITISVGRIKLGHDEVLELLLEELGVETLPSGTVQRFAMFRRMLQEFAEKDTEVFVIVEDALRIGADALSELEALTATDAGVSDGASVILMGNPEIDELLKSPELARLKQRLRLRQKIVPLSARELRAYLKHCFRLAGGEFDSLFAPGSVEVLHALCDGIPRMANNLVESAMTSATEHSENQVAVDRIKEVAAQEYGLQTDVTAPAEVPAVDAAPVPEPEPAPEPDPAPAPEPESDPDPEPEPEPEVEPEVAEEIAASKDNGIPELIQDTLPDLEVLAPQLANPPEPEEVAEPEPAAAANDGIPTLESSASGDTLDEIPDWERDPTLAELRPDLDALEHAMAVAQGSEPDPEPEEIVPPAEELPSNEPPTLVPEITLDREIEAKIEEAAEAIKKTEAEAAAKAEADAEAESTIDIASTGEFAMELPPLPSATPKDTAPAETKTESRPEPEPEPVAEPNSEPVAKPVAEAQPAPEVEQEDPELEKIAEDLSRAKTLDDVDDKMAETLFGEEFSEIAAQIASKVANDTSADDDLELEESVEAPAPVAEFEGAAAVSVPPGPEATPPNSQLDDAASRRLATVRALNGAPNVAPPPPPSAESIVMTDSAATPQPPATAEPIESIEDQINTSMTETLEALNEKHIPVDDDEDGRKGGFFGRFRKS
jgi:type II secretory pathway predicted ATPase ExeA